MVVVAILLSVLAIVTAIGNLLVGLALFRYRQLRTISNCLIGNLAVSDFLLATTVLPLSIANECLGRWAFGPLLCRVWLVMDVSVLHGVDLEPVPHRGRSIHGNAVSGLVPRPADGATPHLRLRRSDLDRVGGHLRAAAVRLERIWTKATFPTRLATISINKCVLFQTPSYVLYSAAGSFFVPFVVTFVLYVGIFCAMRRLGSRRRVRQTRPVDSRPADRQRPSTTTSPWWKRCLLCFGFGARSGSRAAVGGNRRRGRVVVSRGRRRRRRVVACSVTASGARQNGG
jgi:hypothetical protein